MFKKCLLGGLLLLCQTQVYADPPTVKATTVLKTQTSWNGEKIAYPAGQAEITGMIVEIPVGAETGWHSHPVPVFGMLLEGEFEVQLKNGVTKKFRAGEAEVEVMNTLHNGRNPGSVPAKLLVFFAGSANKPLTVKESAP